MYAVGMHEQKNGVSSPFSILVVKVEAESGRKVFSEGPLSLCMCMWTYSISRELVGLFAERLLYRKGAWLVAVGP